MVHTTTITKSVNWGKVLLWIVGIGLVIWGISILIKKYSVNQRIKALFNGSNYRSEAVVTPAPEQTPSEMTVNDLISQIKSEQVTPIAV